MKSQSKFNRIALAIVVFISVAMYFGGFVLFGALLMAGWSSGPISPFFSDFGWF